MAPLSIPTALLVTALASWTIGAFLFGLAGDRRLEGTNRAHRLVGFAYGANGLRLVVQFLSANGVRDRLLLGNLLYVAFVGFIWFGARLYIRPRPFRRSLLLVPAGMVLWQLAGLAFPMTGLLAALPVHLAGGALLGLSGLHIWNLRRIRPFWEVPLLAALLWAQGLSTLTYPFTRHTGWAPYGFLIMVLVGIALGLTFMLGSLREEEHRLTLEVTRRRQTEADLRTSETRFRWAMEATSDGLWDWNVATGEVYYSPAYWGMLGYGPEAWEARVGSWVETIHPDDRDRVLAANQACIDGAVPGFEVEYRLRTRGGAYKWVLGRGQAVARDAGGKAARMLGTHVDIDLRKQQELELRRVNRLYDLLSQLGLCLVRVASRQELLDEFCRIAVETGDYPLVWVGWADHATGRVLPMALAGVEASVLEWAPVRFDQGLESRGLSGTCIREERTVVCQDLRQNPAYAPWLERAEAHRLRASAAFPIRLKGRVAGAFQVYAREPGGLGDPEVRLLEQAAGEISFGLERFAVEAERAGLEAQVQQAQKMESLGTLAGGIAHDMNNVLGAILGLASANAGLHPQDSPAWRAFDTIAKAATRGAGMVQGLLRFARRTPREERHLDLNELVGDVVRILERTTLARVRLGMDLAADLRPVRGDAAALTNALMNLCVNAVDALGEEGELMLRTRNLEPDQVEVTVADTGCGMPAEVLRRAMEPFFTTKAQGKGTGLGLPMVYSTVQAHKGHVEISSLPGRGTTAVLRFPAAPPARPEPAPAEEPGAPQPSGLRVLVVDDDDLVRTSLACQLETLGHTCRLAASGEEALAELEQGLRPDLVVLDLNMPGLGGRGTLPRLRALAPRLPVLVATGRADQAAVDLAGADPRALLLEKPFTLQTLRTSLERAVATGPEVE